MKQLLCSTIFVVAVACVHAAAVGQKTEDRYSTKYNNFDVDSVLNNTKILKSYVKCVLGDGPCTNEGRELARVVPDAIKTECSKCDEKQKSTSLRVMKHLNKHHPDLLEKLLKKFDPKGEHEKKLREQINKADTASAAPASTPTTAQTPSITKLTAESTNKPVTKLETKTPLKPVVPAATVTPAKTDAKIDTKPTPAPAKTDMKPETITKLEAKPSVEKVKPAEIKKPASY